MGYQKSIKLVPPQADSIQQTLSLIESQKSNGKWPHHIQKTRDFVSKVRKVTLLPGEHLSSYDVTALFTSVPIDPALNIIKNLFEQDDTLSNGTVLIVQNIVELLGFCLHNTYFSFQNKFYEQVEGAAMGSPVSPIVANMYMEFLREKLLGLPPIPQVMAQVCG